nr:hypothetical protein Iba_chr02cCG11310 [Ipomoea batatas]
MECHRRPPSFDPHESVLHFAPPRGGLSNVRIFSQPTTSWVVHSSAERISLALRPRTTLRTILMKSLKVWSRSLPRTLKLQLPTWDLVMLPSKLAIRARRPLLRKRKARLLTRARIRPLLHAFLRRACLWAPVRLPSPWPLLTNCACASKTPTTAKKVRPHAGAALEYVSTAAKTFIFRRLEQMIPASDLQAIGCISLLPCNHRWVQLFQAGLNSVIQGLAKDSELMKSAKTTHSKEVKTLKGRPDQAGHQSGYGTKRLGEACTLGQSWTSG